MSSQSYSLKSRSPDSSRPKYHESPKKRHIEKYRTRELRRSRSRSKDIENRYRQKQLIDYPMDHLKEERSEFSKHIVFRQIPIRKQNEAEFIDELGNKLGRIGPIDNIRITERYGDKMDIGLGFKYDSDAINYIDGNKALQISFQSVKISLYPKLSRAFQFYYEKAKQIKTDREYEQRKFQKKMNEHRNKRERSYSQKSQKERSRNEKYKRTPSSSIRSPKKQEKEVILRIFGIPTRYTKQEIIRSITRFNGVEFDVESATWQNFEAVKYLKVIMNQKAGFMFLKQVQETSKFNQKAPLIIQCSDPRDIRKLLKEYQIRLQFSQKVHPYNLYKCLSKYGEVIQMVLQSQQNRIYYVTLHSKRAIKELKNLRVNGQGISMSSLRDGQLVYRPKIQLRKLMQDDKKKE